jgi:hypothetical protein
VRFFDVNISYLAASSATSTTVIPIEQPNPFHHMAGLNGIAFGVG